MDLLLAATSLREVGRAEACLLPAERLAQLASRRPSLCERGLREGWWRGPQAPLPVEESLACFLTRGDIADEIASRRAPADAEWQNLSGLLDRLDGAASAAAAALRARLLQRASNALARLVAPALDAAADPAARAAPDAPAAAAAGLPFAELRALRGKNAEARRAPSEAWFGVAHARAVLDDLQEALAPTSAARVAATFAGIGQRLAAAEAALAAVLAAYDAAAAACDALDPAPAAPAELLARPEQA